MINIEVEETVLITDDLKKIVIESATKMLSELKLESFDLGIYFCGESYIHDLNKKYRDKDQPTDILSFPMFPDLVAGSIPEPDLDDCFDLGDLIIYFDRICNDAKELNFPIEVYIKKLLAHGIAHLLGYSHYTEDAHEKMLPIEKRLFDVASLKV